MKSLSRAQNVLGWILVSVVLLFVWDTTPLYPFRMLAVFFHEMSHGLAAIITGGSVERLGLDPAEGGHALTRGGWGFLILTAGYLGNVVWGGMLMVLATKVHRDHIISFLLGIVLFGVTLFAVRGTFGFFFGLASAAALLVLAIKGTDALNDVVLRFIGVFSCLYPIFDIKSDVIDRSALRSDARMLSEITMVPTVVWGWIWIACAVALFSFFLWLASAPKKEDGRVLK